MFYGEYQHTLDRKGRLIVPSRFREVIREHYIERFFITRGLDRCLFMFPEEEWKLQEQRFRAMPFTKSESRKFNRFYFSGASEIQPDKQGRILIPNYLKEFADIRKEVVILGISNRIEVWSRVHWVEFYKGQEGSFEEIAEKLIEAEGNVQ